MLSFIGRFLRRLRYYKGPTGFSRDLEDEIRFHLAMKTEAKIAEGLPPDQAALKARREFGQPNPDTRGEQQHVGLSILRNPIPGPSLWPAYHVQESQLYHYSGADRGARDRGQHGHLQRRQCGVASAAALS